ncbi:MAG: hypothetical protein DDT32_00827 [Syntrophomonadaceae bacterium]|nr:hypothetical protein [Bacillota bacterium]MBT9147075.1 hypothetical protein [Bacillota bacterium]
MANKRNKDIAIAVLQGETYDNVGILHDIIRERLYQITRRICLYVEPGTEYSIVRLRCRANEIIPKVERIPEE